MYLIIFSSDNSKNEKFNAEIAVLSSVLRINNLRRELKLKYHD